MIPGYYIEDGRILIDENTAGKIRNIFLHYTSGLSLKESAARAGFPLTHSSVKRLIRQRKYAGTDSYPAIVDSDLFNLANEELNRRAASINKKKPERKIKPVRNSFTLDKASKIYTVPAENAQYIYSLIKEAEYE